MGADRILAQAAAKKIAEDISDRSGLGNMWEEIDEETQAEIMKTWEDIIYHYM